MFIFIIAFISWFSIIADSRYSEIWIGGIYILKMFPHVSHLQTRGKFWGFFLMGLGGNILNTDF